MQDLNQQLLQQVRETFLDKFEKSNNLTSLYTKLDKGTATYEDASAISKEIGELLAESYKECIGEEVEVTPEMANAVLKPTLHNNYNLASDAAKRTQEGLNEQAGIGMKAVIPECNEDKISGICNKAVEDYQTDPDMMMRTLFSNTVNYTMSVVDDSVKENADAQFKAGMSPKIVRKMNGTKPCAWCENLAGTYDYPFDTPDEVFHRHRNCYCTVTYTPEGSKVSQDVWSKKWGKEQDFEKNQRQKAYKSVVTRKLTGYEEERSDKFNFKESDCKKYNRNGEPFDVVRIHGRKMPVTVSTYEAGNITRKEVQTIEKSVTRNMGRLGVKTTKYPEICIVSDHEMPVGTIASYSPIDNRVYITRAIANQSKIVKEQMNSGIFAHPENPDSTMLHELQHFKDAWSYRQNGGAITKETYSDYLQKIGENCKIKLDEVGVTSENVEKISRYAYLNYASGQFDEVYAEYIVNSIL